MTARDSSVFAEPMPAERRRWYRERVESAAGQGFRLYPPEHRPDGEDRQPCAFCEGDGDVVNPGNGDPAVKVTDWLRPLPCPRCKGTGKDPNP